MTRPSFSTKIEEHPYQVVHIATHGEFSSKLEDTFILTWDDHLNIIELETLFESFKRVMLNANCAVAQYFHSL
ncbi:CHAT domain-containing protein [[Leptolyngbya] sp. PCC 7376]|uniref:CHAT domain-containing protein n=1 Tax=[Leptolyngbya] sp. PCC 7376 TaxID=111781 RepID=UPI0026D2C8B0